MSSVSRYMTVSHRVAPSKRRKRRTEPFSDKTESRGDKTESRADKTGCRADKTESCGDPTQCPENETRRRGISTRPCRLYNRPEMRQFPRKNRQDNTQQMKTRKNLHSDRQNPASAHFCRSTC